MIEAVITSRARVQVLARLLLHPDQSFYVRQVAELERLPYAAVQRELAALGKAGILSQRRSGNRVYYTANAACPIAPDLRSLLLKTAGLADVLAAALRTLAGRIEVAFVYGSLARGEAGAGSDVDLMVVGDTTFAELLTALQPVQDQLGRDVNPTVYPVGEFREKLTAGHHFLTTVVQGEKLFLVGDADDLTRLAEERVAHRT